MEEKIVDKMNTTTVNGVERHLNYSIDVAFCVMDEFGSVKSFLEIIDKDDREAFSAIAWIAAKMINDAELVRRSEGYDAMPFVEISAFSPHMQLWKFRELKDDVAKAIGIGYDREFAEPEKETDLGLEELNAKKPEAGG